MADANQLHAGLRVLDKRLTSTLAVIQQQQQQLQALSQRPRTITEEIDQIPGRRIETVLNGEVTFDINDLGRRGNSVVIQVSQDGPFIMTHYPMVLWRPTLPSNASDLNRWRPVSTYPLPTQVLSTNIIDIMYELADGGSQRNFQNGPRAPLLSRPDNVVPCAVPTLWAANSAIQLTPTYLAMDFSAEIATTQGTLHVDIIGYRIVNL